ncbi:MAG: phosphotransferase family protein [Acidimicrobiaceae bacterium]|nr:phosphotransferase family protein [Acidimicrobiaceae bacterium]
MSSPDATSTQGGVSPAHAVPEGIDASKVSAWFAGNIPGVELPLRFELIAGGRSNLTFEVDDAAGRRYVLRRPPTGHLLPTAHDMAREHRIISALGPAGIPVAPALGLCEDPAVNGAPFYVMGFVEGHIIRNRDEIPEQFDRRHVGESLADTLAAIHAVDPDAVGLGDLGRREGYISRQLKRWYGQYQASRDEQGGPDVPDVDEVHNALVECIPDQRQTGVVHGDYRLDNCVVDDRGDVAAVLDWELCTLGDPLADVGQLLVYWTEPGERNALGNSATADSGFLTRAQLAERYARTAGLDLGELDFYVAFAYWKLACILEGVYTRYLGGAMGKDGYDFSFYPDSIRSLASQAKATAARL